MKRIKIVQLIHGLSIGGAENLVKDYALKLDKSRFELYVVCFDHEDSPYEQLLADNGINVIYLSDMAKIYSRSGILRYISIANRYRLLRKCIRNISPDIIHVHLTINSYAKYARPKKPAAIVYTHHSDVNVWNKTCKSDVKNVRWLMNNYPMKLITLNDDARRDMIRIIGDEHSADIVVLNNGIDVDRFRNAKSRSEVRHNLDIPQDAFVVGHVGRFAVEKNHKFIVEVFDKIAKNNESAYLLLVGAGELLEQVRTRLQELHLENRVLILSNRLDVQDLMKAMDVLVFPSLSEAFPLTLLEAQASGLRCMVSDTVSTSTRISNYIRYKSISDAPSEWASDILSWEKDDIRYDNLELWDMKENIHKLEDMYMQLYNNMHS